MPYELMRDQTSIPEPLTNRQKEVLDILTREIRTGKPPTIRKLGEALGLSSPASVHRHLTNLEKKGYIIFRKSSYSVSLATQDEELKHDTLTDFEKKVLDFVTEYVSRRGISPTNREIVDALEETSSLGKVHTTLKSLERKGRVVLKEGQAYSIVLVPPLEDTRYPVPMGKVPSDARTFLPERNTEVMWLPLKLLLDSFKFSDAGNIFLVRVADDSMLGVGILEGDYVLARRQDKARDGNIVVAVYKGRTPSGHLEGKVILRSYKRQWKTYSIRLEPANNAIEAIEAKADEVSILGIGVGLFRRGFLTTAKEQYRSFADFTTAAG